MSRYQTVISREADQSEDHWLNKFKEKLAVQPKSKESIYDQMTSIMHGSRSKYPSVEAAVQDMKERSGLAAYLNSMSKSGETEGTTKTASDNNSVIDKKIPVESTNVPIVIIKVPAINKTLENIIHTSRGNSSLPAILDRIMSIHKNDVNEAKDWEDPKLLSFISRKNLEEKSKSDFPSDDNHLGNIDNLSMTDIDPANTDAFYGLNPAK